MKGEVRSLGGSKSISLGFRRDCLTVYLLCVCEERRTRPGEVFWVAIGVSLLRME